MADVVTLSARAIRITGAPGLDWIEVFWVDYEPSRGSVTITCYGNAWTAYFGAMGGRDIRQFFAGSNTGYLVTKMGISQVLKSRKKDDAYLMKIIDAVKEAIRG